LRAPESLAAELRGLVREEQARSRAPSVSAAVFRGGELLWSEAVGIADAERGLEATPETQYEIGSITKTFTAAAILQLRDAGQLDLEDSLAAHIPEAGHELTLRRMLSHLSGLQRETPGGVWETLEFPTAEELPARAADAERVLAPGERWHYSNLAFALLGEVVTRRSGLPYTQYVDERLIGPLGLTRTTWEPVEPAARGYFVHPFTLELLAERHADHRGTAAAGALLSTTADLARWGAFLADPEPSVLAPGSVEEMHAPRVMIDPEQWTLGWGLGLLLSRVGERVLAGHTGGTNGFLTAVLVSRKARIGAVALTNTTADADPEKLAARLATAAIEALPGEPEPSRPGPPAPPELESVLGNWWSEGTEFVFRWREGRLEAESLAASPRLRFATFEPERADRYRTVSGRERGELLEILRDDDGAAIKLYWATYPFTRRPAVFGQ
jgi:CubicO group peptidase (beta-lactamase class C family)